MQEAEGKTKAEGINMCDLRKCYQLLQCYHNNLYIQKSKDEASMHCWTNL